MFKRETTVQTIGERIAQRRMALGLSQEQLGELVGRTQGNVSQWESGTSFPPTAVLSPLVEKLQCSVDWLLHGDLYPHMVESPVIGATTLNASLIRFPAEKVELTKVKPMGINRPCVAVRINDDAMSPAYEKGDMVFLQFEMASPDECLGRDALVTLPGEDGRELLRRVLPGSRVGTYALKTHNGGGVIETPLAGARVVLGSVKAEGLQ